MKAYVADIRSFAQQRQLKKGSNLFFQGEIPRSGMLITDGVVRAYSIASSGEERTIAFYTKDDILPVSWLMSHADIALFYYEAMTDVRLLQFSKQQFEKNLLTNSDSIRGVLEYLSKNYTAAMIRINGLEQSRADEKIAFALYYLVFRYGIEKSQGIFDISIQLRHSTLASLVGLSRESTTKVLRTLQRKSIISYAKGIYSVDKKRLEDYVGEDTFRDIALG